MVVLCELFSTGFRFDASDLREQGPVDEAFLSQLSQDTRCVVLGGHARRVHEHLENTLSIFDEGKLLTRYTKLHAFGPSGEASCFLPGAALPLFRWRAAGALVQPAICYDLRFAELFLRGREAGAEMIVLASAWPSVREHHWRSLLVARAIECQAIVAACNALGECPAPMPQADGSRRMVPHPGASMVVSHVGSLLADAGSSVGVASAAIDMHEVRRWRTQFNVFADRRALPLPSIL
jgi:predicted amidohydrolase